MLNFWKFEKLLGQIVKNILKNIFANFYYYSLSIQWGIINYFSEKFSDAFLPFFGIAMKLSNNIVLKSFKRFVRAFFCYF